MSKQLDQLRDAIDNILDADEVIAEAGGGYRVDKGDGDVVLVRQSSLGGHWRWCFESGAEVPYSPVAASPEALVAMALMSD